MTNNINGIYQWAFSFQPFLPYSFVCCNTFFDNCLCVCRCPLLHNIGIGYNVMGTRGHWILNSLSLLSPYTMSYSPAKYAIIIYNPNTNDLESIVFLIEYQPEHDAISIVMFPHNCWCSRKLRICTWSDDVLNHVLRNTSCRHPTKQKHSSLRVKSRDHPCPPMSTEPNPSLPPTQPLRAQFRVPDRRPRSGHEANQVWRRVPLLLRMVPGTSFPWGRYTLSRDQSWCGPTWCDCSLESSQWLSNPICRIARNYLNVNQHTHMRLCHQNTHTIRLTKHFPGLVDGAIAIIRRETILLQEIFTD